MTVEEIMKWMLLLTQLSGQLASGFDLLRKVLADARASGGMTEAQWADLNTQLAESESARHAAVDALVKSAAVKRGRKAGA